jgi:hypothetical protein
MPYCVRLRRSGGFNYEPAGDYALATPHPSAIVVVALATTGEVINARVVNVVSGGGAKGIDIVYADELFREDTGVTTWPK